jgi:hypothetical protein
MSKHTFNWILRGWISLASGIALVSGWVAFSHSAKPGAAANAAVNATTSEGQFAPIPTLAPLLSVGSGSTSVQPLPRQQTQTLSQPRLRTRGS